MWGFKSTHKEDKTIETIERMLEQIKARSCKMCLFVTHEPAEYRVTSYKEVITVIEEVWRCEFMDKDNNQLSDFDICLLFNPEYSTEEL